MMRNLVFATGNKHKLKEVQSFLGEGFALSCLKDVGIYEEIPETADTLEGNAVLKARYVYERTGKSCFSDDTGLEVEALNGEPGIYSARYAGEGKDSQDNMNLLLKNLEGTENRTARFRTVIAYISATGKCTIFEGEVKGKIAKSHSGKDGFGYDPIFVPFGYEQTFSEISLEEKNTISHRARAMQKFSLFLNKL